MCGCGHMVDGNAGERLEIAKHRRCTAPCFRTLIAYPGASAQTPARHKPLEPGFYDCPHNGRIQFLCFVNLTARHTAGTRDVWIVPDGADRYIAFHDLHCDRYRRAVLKCSDPIFLHNSTPQWVWIIIGSRGDPPCCSASINQRYFFFPHSRSLSSANFESLLIVHSPARLLEKQIIGETRLSPFHR